jgi:hypothetical protein
LWALMTAIHLNNPQGVLGQGDLLGFFQGVEGTILLSLASVIFALLIATIPMTARRILMGEYSPIGAAIAWGRGAASKVLAGTTMAAATGGTGAVAAAGALAVNAIATRSELTVLQRPSQSCDLRTALKPA